MSVCVGLTTPGLYRTGGVNSKVQRLMTTVFGKKLHPFLCMTLFIPEQWIAGVFKSQ